MTNPIIACSGSLDPRAIAADKMRGDRHEPGRRNAEAQFEALLPTEDAPKNLADPIQKRPPPVSRLIGGINGLEQFLSDEQLSLDKWLAKDADPDVDKSLTPLTEGANTDGLAQASFTLPEVLPLLHQPELKVKLSSDALLEVGNSAPSSFLISAIGPPIPPANVGALSSLVSTIDQQQPFLPMPAPGSSQTALVATGELGSTEILQAFPTERGANSLRPGGIIVPMGTQQPSGIGPNVSALTGREAGGGQQVQKAEEDGSVEAQARSMGLHGNALHADDISLSRGTARPKSISNTSSVRGERSETEGLTGSVLARGPAAVNKNTQSEDSILLPQVIDAQRSVTERGGADTTTETKVIIVGSETHLPPPIPTVHQIGRAIEGQVQQVLAKPSPLAVSPQISPVVRILELQLEPRELGPVTIRMSLSDTSLRINLKVRGNVLATQIEGSRQELAKALSDTGCSLDELIVQAVSARIDSSVPLAKHSADTTSGPQQAQSPALQEGFGSGTESNRRQSNHGESKSQERPRSQAELIQVEPRSGLYL